MNINKIKEGSILKQETASNYICPFSNKKCRTYKCNFFRCYITQYINKEDRHQLGYEEYKDIEQINNYECLIVRFMQKNI
jgi:hypothetical protein